MMKAANVPNVRQSRRVWGLKKLNTKIRNMTEFIITSCHSP
jgi:hypothetical protein